MSEDGMAYVASPRGIIKIAEAVLIVVTMAIWYGIELGWQYFVTGTIMTAVYGTFALGAQNLVIGPSRVAELLLYGLSALFLVISSIIIFAKLSSSVSIACGVFCLISGLVYGGDVVLTYMFTDDSTS